ncbi:unnamed protein product [Parajaminaea phylloscopi]
MHQQQPPAESEQELRHQHRLPPRLLVERNLSYVLASQPKLPLQLVRSLLTTSEPPLADAAPPARATGPRHRGDGSKPSELPPSISTIEDYAQRMAGTSTRFDIEEDAAILELVRALSLALATPRDTPETAVAVATERLSLRLDLASALCLCKPPRLAQAKSTLDVAREEARGYEMELKKRNQTRHRQSQRSDHAQGAQDRLSDGAAPAPITRQGDAKLDEEPSPTRAEYTEILVWQATLLLASANVAVLIGKEDEARRLMAWRRKAQLKMDTDETQMY